MFVILKLIIL